ncbi:MAG TPA: adenylate/guanylate cyclase domain-containing protein [Acidimicrobiia bacterium]|jgi:predicted ATPase/class 3 adenylate cyclase
MTLPTGTITFLFTDIEGSTRLLQALGERYPGVLGAHAGIIRQAIAEFHGHEVGTEGDSFFVAFTSASDAVGCATRIQRGLAEHPWPAGNELRVRIGLHTGEGRVSAGAYVGLDVHRAARIGDAGHGGQVVLSATTAVLTEHALPAGTRLVDLGTHELRDLTHRVHLYQLEIDGLPSEFPPLRTHSVSRVNLPKRGTAFFGRAQETEAVIEALERHRLVTLTGGAGVGKSSLAVHAAEAVAASFPDGLWFVEIARLSSGEAIPGAVAGQIQIVEISTQPLIETLMSRLAMARGLLVLDGCEHLVGPVADFVEKLLTNTREIHVLVTTREVLSISAENVFRLGPLPAPPATIDSIEQLMEYDAMALFVDRAKLVRRDFVLTSQNALMVAEICRRLDGIPLAIELAAARLKVLSAQQLASRLDQQFAVLTGGSRDSLPHQQTLLATLDWSYDLLGPAEQVLFRRLSVFAGGFSLEAAEAVGSGGALDQASVLDLLGRLVDTSLVLATASEPVRYRMLEPITQYGRMRLVESGEDEEVEAKHTLFFLDLATTAADELLGSSQIEWVRRLERDRYNLIGVLSRLEADGDAEALLRLTGALRWYWVFVREIGPGKLWLEKALAHREGASPAALAPVLNGLGVILVRRFELERARQVFQEAESIYMELGDRRGVARQRFHLATVAWFADDSEATEELATEAQKMSEQEGDEWTRAWALAVRGTVARTQLRLEEARALLSQSHEIFETSSGKLDIGWSYLRLGALARDLGNYELAKERYERGRTLLAESGDAIGLAHADAGLGAMAWLNGDHGLAIILFESVLAGFSRAEEVADNFFELKTMIQGEATFDQVRQVALWNQERATMADRGTRAALAEYLYHLGKMALRRAEIGRGRAALLESLSLCLEAGDYRGMIIALIALGRESSASGDFTRAATLFGAAAGLAEWDKLDPWPPVDESDFDDSVGVARGVLPKAEFDASWDRGYRLDAAGANAYARAASLVT